MNDEPLRPAAATSPSLPLIRSDVLWHLLATHNPLYAVSAALVFYGLRISFQAEAAGHALALFGALATYVALLTATAICLRRLGALWEDVRMLALLVLLLLLGMSVTFDQTILAAPWVGRGCFFVGWLLAAATCELLFGGLHVRLPIGYRLPFHALLALFFVYPPLVAWAAAGGNDETLSWVLFAFTPTASALLLTLLPAARRGAAYVADNGTPWRWPLYPWTLFVFLGAGIVGRAYYLCYSFHAVPDGESIFGAYFLAPLVYAVGIMLLVAGRRTGTRVAALAVPTACVLLASIRPAHDPTFDVFANYFFTKTFGAGPLTTVLVVGVAFYLAAVVRRVPGAMFGLFAALLLTTVIHGPARSLIDWQTPSVWSAGAAALLALAAVVWRNDVRWGWATVGAVMLTTAVTMRDLGGATLALATYHAALVAAAAVGLYFHDRRGTAFRALAGGLLFLAYTEALAGGGLGLFRNAPKLTPYYPLPALIAGVGYALLRRDRAALLFATILTVEWLGLAGVREYVRWRKLVAGLDAIAAGLAAFAAAVVVSLLKTEWWAARQTRGSRIVPENETAYDPTGES